MNIKKLEQIKTALSKILEIEKVEMKSATDEAGNILSWEKDTDVPEVEDVVYIETDNDEKAFAPAGEYFIINEIGERVKVTVGEEGVVTATEIVYEEEKPAEEPAEEPVEEETFAEEGENEPEAAPEEAIVEQTIEDITAEKNAEIEALKAKIEVLRAENEELKAKIAELEAEPQSEPVEQQFEAMVKKQQKVSGALKYAQALNK